MLELTKTVLQKVSFDKSLFRKELKKAKHWLKKDDLIKLKAWGLITFTANQDLIQDFLLLVD